MRDEVAKRIVEEEKKKEMEGSRSLNILVVDDEREICKMFKKWLFLEEHRVKSALTGKKAINLIKKNDFDIVFLDILMPGITAVEVLEKIKEVSPETRVIMMTGQLADRYLLDEMKQKGASGFLQKPFKIEDVNKIID